MKSRPLRIGVYSLDLPRYACPQVRIIRPFDRLRSHFDVKWGVTSNGQDYAITLDVLDWADMVIIQRYFPLAQTWDLVERILASGKPVVYDIDDLLTHVPPEHPGHGNFQRTAEYVRRLLPRASAVTVPSNALRQELSAHAGNVRLLPNLIDERLWSNTAARARDGAEVIIAFAGTDSHVPDLEMIEPALCRVLERQGGTAELVLFGCATSRLKRSPHVRFVPFTDSYPAYARQLMSLEPDIGLAPLRDTRFNRCKSDIKFLEYAAVGAAGVYSAVDPYAERVRQGGTGVLVKAVEAWEESLNRLVEDAGLRRHMAEEANLELQSSGTLEQGVGQYLSLYRDLAGL